MSELNLTPLVTVETRILGHSVERVEVTVRAGDIRVSDLIRCKIEAEWRTASRGGSQVVGRESLPPDDVNEAAGLPVPLSAEDAFRSAIDGYRAGWYIILVDGEEPGGLDSVVRLTSASRVSFVRVYPLPAFGGDP